MPKQAGSNEYPLLMSSHKNAYIVYSCFIVTIEQSSFVYPFHYDKE